MHLNISDYLSDIVENSIEAGAECISIEIIEDERYLNVSVRDDGKGMDEKIRSEVLNPFFTDGDKHKRKVGFGLPFLSQALEGAGGRLEISSEEEKGTEVSFRFDRQNIDTPPMGDLPSTLALIMSRFSGRELEINRTLETAEGNASYVVKRSSLMEVVGQLEDAGAIRLVRDYLRSREEEAAWAVQREPIIYEVEK